MAPRSSQKPDPARRNAIVDAAAMAFAMAGYQRTQMADIAARANVALGTLYRYAESKEELFAAALTRGVGHDPGAIAGLGTISDVEEFFVANLNWFGWVGDQVEAAFYVKRAPAPFTHMLGAIYDAIAERRLAIRILDRSAHDLPRLNEVYVRGVREPVLIALAAYLDAQARAGRIAPLENKQASARLILETCAWFAMHRLFSPGGADIADPEARRTTLTHLTAAFAAKD